MPTPATLGLQYWLDDAKISLFSQYHKTFQARIHQRFTFEHHFSSKKENYIPMIIRNFAHTQEPTKPLNDAQMCGSFIYIRFMATTIPFDKPYPNSRDLVAVHSTR